MTFWVLLGFASLRLCAKSVPALLAALLLCVSLSAETTVVYDGTVSKVTNLLAGERDLWLTLPDLTRVSGFVIKPQGACLGDLCVPIPKSRKQAFQRQNRFNLSELARTLNQPEVEDSAHNIRLFGPRPEVAMKVQSTLEAPNFTLPDWKGRPRSLSEFRGKKVLLITWASW